MPKGATA